MHTAISNRLPGSSAPGAPRHGWLLYDGSCGVCSRGVAFWHPTLQRHGFDIAALQETWVRDRLHMPEDELVSMVRLLLQNGQHIAGADVYRYIMRRIWWAYPIWALSLVPGLRAVFDWGYRKFAERRHRISQVCKIRIVTL